MRLLIAAAFVALAGLPARAAEVSVLSAGALRAVLAEVAPQFEREKGDRLNIAYSTAGGVEQRLLADEAADVVLVTKPRMGQLEKAGKIAAGSVVVLGRSPLALAVRHGAPKPDIGTVGAVKRTLLAAASIAFTDPASGGTSGIHFASELVRLGLADPLKSKLVPVKSEGGAPPAVGKAVADGRAELGVQPISELNRVTGIDIVGPLPAEMQTPDLTYAAGLAAGAKQPAAARALLALLSGPVGTAAVRAAGMIAGDAR